MKRTHGHTIGGESRTYMAWCNMRSRCENPKNRRYPTYGARGIIVSPEWNKFDQFLADMGDAPEGLTLERRENNKGYSKDNCRWATRDEQAQNKTTNRNLTYKGETHCLKEWARRLGVSRAALHARLADGWSVERALSTPVASRKKNIL